MATTPRTSKDPRYLADKREQAAALYEQHQSVRRVAELMGVSTRRAWEYLDDAGVDMRPVGRPAKGE